MQRFWAPLRLPLCWAPVPRKKRRLKKWLLLRRMPRLLPATPPLMPLLPQAMPLLPRAMPLLRPVMLLPLLSKKPRRRSSR